MDSAGFDHLTRIVSFTLSRRGLSGALGAVALGLSGLAEAKKKRRRSKKKKVNFNAFGCVDVGKFCQNDDQCCSGKCEGKKGKKKCKGHDQSTCQAGQDACRGVEVSCTTTAGDVGECARTTGKASYCAGDGDCFACAKDADCVPFCGPRAGCIVCADCIEVAGTETLCVGPGEDDCTFPDTESG